jgi:hypothetical protein
VFSYCLLRNVQFTLHRMIGRRQPAGIHFVFPTEAIFAGEPGRPYPAAMVTLADRFRHQPDAEAVYEHVVAPFVDRLVTQYPVEGYPTSYPTPALAKLVSQYEIAVVIDDRFRRVARPSDSGKRVVLEFRSPPPSRP